LNDSAKIVVDRIDVPNFEKLLDRVSAIQKDFAVEEDSLVYAPGQFCTHNFEQF
jgi:hypothetical protein